MRLTCLRRGAGLAVSMALLAMPLAALVFVAAPRAQATQPVQAAQPSSQADTATPPKAADPRRRGIDFMSPALQALQRDDSQNPAQLWVQEGAVLWAKPPLNADGRSTGQACVACHTAGSERGMAARHPAFEGAGVAGPAVTALGAAMQAITAPLAATTGPAATPAQRPLTLAARIDHCRQRHQQAPPQNADGPEVLALAAYLAQASRGLPLQPPNDPRLATWQAHGERLWLQRLGQINLSCAQCHDQHAGAKLGGAVIPQGHPTGYPSYRLEWQGLGSLQRRMRACLVGVRAEPFTPSADEWLALETYLAKRASGLLMEGAALRP